jgi:hypothetical protein
MQKATDVMSKEFKIDEVFEVNNIDIADNILKYVCAVLRVTERPAGLPYQKAREYVIHKLDRLQAQVRQKPV